MGDVYFIVIPIVVVVVILKLCLIFWRIWLYQKRRERVYTFQTHTRATPPARPSTRIVGVERCLGPEGYTQRTAYVINEQGLPPRHVTRVVTIRPRETGRPQNPNMPPSYDQAVTGKDKSVKVNSQPQQQQQAEVPNRAPTMPQGSSSAQQPSAPLYSTVAPPQAPPPPQQQVGGLPPPPAYVVTTPSAPVAEDGDTISLDAEDTTRLLA